MKQFIVLFFLVVAAAADPVSCRFLNGHALVDSDCKCIVAEKMSGNTLGRGIFESCLGKDVLASFVEMKWEGKWIMVESLHCEWMSDLSVYSCRHNKHNEMEPELFTRSYEIIYQYVKDKYNKNDADYIFNRLE